jgi:hypothetical protein
MSIFLSIMHLFYIMYSWLKFILITKLSLFFSFFSYEDIIFYILKNITVAKYGQNASIKKRG